MSNKSNNIRLLPYYRAHKLPIIESVLEDNKKGLIKPGRSKSGEYIFIMHHSGFGYLDTNGKFDDALTELQSVVLNDIDTPQYFHLYCFADFNINKIQKQHFNYKLRKRIRYLYDDAIITDPKQDIGKFKLKKSVYSHEVPSEFFSLIKPFWDSWNSFKENSIASWICNMNGQPVGLCYASSIANDVAEVDIYVLENYRRIGLGEILTQHFIQQTREHNLLISWECFNDNVASIMLADKAGFKQINTINFLSLFNKNK